MRVVQAIYDRLAGDLELDGLLARTMIPPGTAPAIYDIWAAQDTEFPYLVYRWTSLEGNHWGKRSSPLNVDVWTLGSSTVEAEVIRNRVIELLDQRKLEADESGQIRVYLNHEGVIPEDEPGIVHWNMEFEVIWWRKEFIGQLEGA